MLSINPSRQPTACRLLRENSKEEAELEAIADAMDTDDTMARLAPLLK